MTIAQAISKTQALKPHQYDADTIVGWLSELDGNVYNDIVQWHENTASIAHGPYSAVDDINTELMIPDPYSDAYIKYLFAQIDFANAEFSRYNNSMIMFNESLSAFANNYNRTKPPKQGNCIRIG